MDSFFLFISEVMFERVDEMKEVIKHLVSPAGGESSIFALCSPLSEADSHIPIRRSQKRSQRFKTALRLLSRSFMTFSALSALTPTSSSASRKCFRNVSK